MEYDRNDLSQFVDFMESSDDREKARAFIQMNANDRAAYLYQFRALTQSNELDRRKRATMWNIERKLANVDRELRNAGR